jgi:hypothetical protein
MRRFAKIGVASILAAAVGGAVAYAQFKGPTSSSHTSFRWLFRNGVAPDRRDSVDGYRMVGIPDGLGAFDNGDRTFTLLMNHELGSTLGAVRAWQQGRVRVALGHR